MPRDIDERKKQKALRKLRKARDLAEQGLGPPLTDWEQSFLDEVEERIETYGSAFADPEKGRLEEPMSAMQMHKLKEIDKKARGKDKKRPFSQRPTLNQRDTVETETPAIPAPDLPAMSAKRKPVRGVPAEPDTVQGEENDKPTKPPFLRVIDGGKADGD